MPEFKTLLKTLLAVLTVLAVVVITGLFKLPLLPFRLIRGMFRERAKTVG